MPVSASNTRAWRGTARARAARAPVARPGSMLILALLVASPLVGQESSASRAPRLLFLTHAGLYKHASLRPAEEAVTAWGRESGFDVTAVQGYEEDPDSLDLGFLTPEYLARFDGLMMMTNGNLPVSDEQKRAIVDFVRSGKGFVGVHNAALTFYDYPPFGRMLGGYFLRPVAQDRLFVLRVEDREHPATRMLGSSWPLVDEFYVYGREEWDPSSPDENVDELFGNPIPVAFSRDRVHVLLSIDTDESDLDGLPFLDPGGDYPQAWYREFGEGRSFYTSIGHTARVWNHDPVFRAHLTGGIRWALGLEDG